MTEDHKLGQPGLAHFSARYGPSNGAWPPLPLALGFVMAAFMVFFMAASMDGMAGHGRFGFALGHLGCLEQWWLQVQTFEVAKHIDQALKCHRWLHTWNAIDGYEKNDACNAMLAKNAHAMPQNG